MSSWTITGQSESHLGLEYLLYALNANSQNAYKQSQSTILVIVIDYLT